MANNGFYLEPGDHRAIQALLKRDQSTVQGSSVFNDEDAPSQSPEVYVIRHSVSGADIPGMSEPVPGTFLPGKAICNVWKINRATEYLEQVFGNQDVARPLTKTVFNKGTTLPYDFYTARRTKYGRWLVENTTAAAGMSTETFIVDKWLQDGAWAIWPLNSKRQVDVSANGAISSVETFGIPRQPDNPTQTGSSRYIYSSNESLFGLDETETEANARDTGPWTVLKTGRYLLNHRTLFAEGIGPFPFLYDFTPDPPELNSNAALFHFNEYLDIFTAASQQWSTLTRVQVFYDGTNGSGWTHSYSGERIVLLTTGDKLRIRSLETDGAVLAGTFPSQVLMQLESVINFVYTGPYIAGTAASVPIPPAVWQVNNDDITISQWDDQIGTNDATQGTGSLQPAITSLSARQALLFDGTDDYMSLGSTRTHAGAFSFAAAIRRTDNSGIDEIVGHDASNYIACHSTAHIRVRIAGSHFDFVIPGVVNDTDVNIIVVTRSSGDAVNVYLNNTASTSNPQTLAGTYSMSQISSSTAAQCFHGKIGDLQFWDEELTSLDATAVYNELADKWISETDPE